MAAVYGEMFFSMMIAVILIYVIAWITVEENKDQISLLKVFGYRKNSDRRI
jgi:putative ABC transport system permease protein